MNRRQQHLLVVASGLAILVVVIAVDRSWATPQPDGWFNYSPDSGLTWSSTRSDIWRRAAIWLAGIASWAIIGVRLYRRSSTGDGAATPCSGT